MDTEIFTFYKKLIALRKNEPALVYGSFEVLDKKKDRFVYKRMLNGREYIIDCNLGTKPQKAYTATKGYRCILSSAAKENILKAYGVRVWKK